MAARGWFITLEGGEGAGKSTSLAFIKRYLESKGHAVLVTREPGGTALGEQIRELLLHKHDLHIHHDTELLLMFAARAQHLHEVILPAIEAGQIVLCDRFTDATYAYQGGGRGIARERIQYIEQWVQQGIKPDLTLLFDLPVQQGLTRAGARSEPDRFESEQLAFFERVRQAYRDIARAEPERVKVIDSGQDLDEVEQQLQAVIDRHIECYGQKEG